MCQASNILGKSFDCGSLYDRRTTLATQLPNAASRHLLEYNWRVGSDNSDPIAIDKEIGNSPDQRRQKRRMKMRLGFVHEYEGALLHTFYELCDYKENNFVARTQPIKESPCTQFKIAWINGQ